MRLGILKLFLPVCALSANIKILLNLSARPKLVLQTIPVRLEVFNNPCRMMGLYRKSTACYLPCKCNITTICHAITVDLCGRCDASVLSIGSGSRPALVRSVKVQRFRAALLTFDITCTQSCILYGASTIKGLAESTYIFQLFYNYVTT